MEISPADRQLACYQPSPFEGLQKTEEIISTAKRVVEDAFFAYRESYEYNKKGGWEKIRTKDRDAQAEQCKLIMDGLEEARKALRNVNPEEVRVTKTRLEESLKGAHLVGSLNCINSIKALGEVLNRIDSKQTMQVEASGEEPEIEIEPLNNDFADEKVA